MKDTYDHSQYPAYPSAKATITTERYTAVVESLEGVPQVFFDGTTVLLPDSETAASEFLRTQFDAVVKSGCSQDWEFAT